MTYAGAHNLNKAYQEKGRAAAKIAKEKAKAAKKQAKMLAKRQKADPPEEEEVYEFKPGDW